MSRDQPSTSSSNGIPLYQSSPSDTLAEEEEAGGEERGYKLIELPPELVELLESEDPPVMTLHPSQTAALLKTTTTTTTGDKNDKTYTYSLRQKNTSNALILLEPTGTGTGAGAGAGTGIGTGIGIREGEGAGLGLRAIATLHETIELVAEAGEAPAPRVKGKWHEKFGRGR